MDVDWESWSPRDRATLLFIVEEEAGRLLLIEKKRGLGAGKINAPGGRIEPDESAFDAAVRELREEVGVGATGVVEHGELSFHFVDGYTLHCHVFRADACVGEPIETDEAKPIWTPLDAIPWPRMWADDAIWLPRLLRREHFQGRFIFDGDRMLSHDVRAR
ncbi:MAG: 8-oxo-dGTP diphosphatase [Labilithrix sp.]|nr:8-oxo-dGTP diphosphatase [Labilithrix sp.]MCW5817284.1 8-oxo-dGTP diphosphatase [Labilithrix sp.]